MERYEGLQKSLAEFVVEKDAGIGVAVILNDSDTVSVNADCQFPMLSVYKFPIALAWANSYQKHNRSLNNPIVITAKDLKQDTYSPLTERLLAADAPLPDSLMMQARELLRYMLQLSDNNASDIILREAGGAGAVNDFLSGLGIKGINVLNSEAEMQDDNLLCYRNSSSPIAMATLLNRFNREFNDSIFVDIKQIMERCETGENRLLKPLRSADVSIGHKTGTGFLLPDGRLMAINDVAYVNFTDGTHYSIAVFVEDSGYSMAETESIIAEISKIVIDAIGLNGLDRSGY